jgi:VanZ family protein
MLAFVLAVISAALDEFHQSFVASRTGSAWDVIIDCFGALAGLVIYWCLTGKRRSNDRQFEIHN